MLFLYQLWLLWPVIKLVIDFVYTELFTLENLLQMAIDGISGGLGWLLSFYDPIVSTQFQDFASMTAGPMAQGILALVAYVIDVFLPWAYVEKSLFGLLILWMTGNIIRFAMFVLHQFWGAEGVAR